MSTKSLYDRLGGYDAIVAFSDNLLPRLVEDKLLGRFWQNRGADGIQRERQLLIDYIAFKTGGPMYYTGRDMKTTHLGMKISHNDWQNFIGHINATLKTLNVLAVESSQVIEFVQSLKNQIVE